MTFPVLKTAAAAQYPFERVVQFSTQAVRFLDGSRQSYRIYASGLRQWILKLDLLDEQELGEVIGFMEAQGSTPFAYTDPVSGTTAPKCVLSGEQFDAGMTDEMRGQARLVIEEIV
ncbi:MAG TPA: hypothetical protein VHZ74_17665 [Bryobacteraceae bacterium]|jgi:hypothetical protein|nr:hypothetical protein [Bryobacteraceae bacterium]